MARKTLAETLGQTLAETRSRVTVPDRLRGTALRLAAVSAVALLAANCSTNPQKLAAGPGAGNGIDPKYGVRASPRLYNEGDVIPKGGGRRFSGKPYVVAGRTYVPREDARGYVREGMASWYGAAFHGRQTANGEVFDRHAIVAAHPTLPLPSYARVTNTTNGRSMVVRVNDRGPYHADRVMDVSEEVAQALEFHRKGTTHVRVEYIGKASVAGSDDRKLMATLRTDGRPAGLRGGPVMLADLGPSEEPEALARDLAKPVRAPLAFKPAPEREAEEPRPAARPAPVLVARASVGVPPALQPTAARAGAFKPVAVAGLNPALDARPVGKDPAKGEARGQAKAQPTARLAAAEPGLRGAAMVAGPAKAGAKAPAAASPAKPAPTRLAAAPVPAKPQTGAPHASRAAPAVAQAAKSSPTPAKPSAVAAKAPAGPAKAQVAGKPHRGDRVAAIY
ncbi:septal ring lytic transglycosylase RlpA family protein [Methylobacterium radiodurans]|uniref:Endolytic peptidoglycan transglycosylase RlpA n=1 Tax=Methylobacterium radiodurans TaxID=2202828 RepID=A0A2U8VV44_9HYPH|nr:septal ring lytic transglycosylase RlpA family protein [Methylobacterium radiodurans]AWN37321.1 septal ring lytic transglycosylase RlpA family protein [Methylobacterium radiodurans]